MIRAKESQGGALEAQVRRVIGLHKTCQEIDRKSFELRRQAVQALVAVHKNFTRAMDDLSVEAVPAK